MKVSITDKNENHAMKRTELKFEVDEVEIPPSRKDVREKIAALQNVKSEQVIVSEISHSFGSKKVNGMARIYASKEELEKTELKYMVGRNIGQKKRPGPEEGKKAEEAGSKEAEKPTEGGEKPKEAENVEKPAEAEKKEGKAEEKKEGE